MPFLLFGVVALLISAAIGFRAMRADSRKIRYSLFGSAVAIWCFVQPELILGLNGFDHPGVIRVIGVGKGLVGITLIVLVILSLRGRWDSERTRTGTVVRNTFSVLSALYFLMAALGSLLLFTFDKSDAGKSRFTINDSQNGVSLFGKDYSVHQTEHGCVVLHRTGILQVEINSKDIPDLDFPKLKQAVLDGYAKSSEVSNVVINEDQERRLVVEFRRVQNGRARSFHAVLLHDQKHQRIVEVLAGYVLNSQSQFVRATHVRFFEETLKLIDQTAF